MSQAHKPCTEWTIQIKMDGMMFHITDIHFSDIAEACADGIRAKYPQAEVKVYLAGRIEES